MDPDETLRQLRELADRILAGDPDPDAHDAVRLGELVAALDGWLTAGGFPPARWATAQWLR
jgi:hypothetical protein